MVLAAKGYVVENTGRYARVRLRTEDFLIEGSIYLGAKAGGYKGRISDLLGEEAGFLTLTDVKMHSISAGEEAEKPIFYEVLILRKGEIKFVIPFD